jgi:hypothetical protein
MDELTALQDTIRRLYGCEADYLESVPVREQHPGGAVRSVVVEVFALRGHPQARRCYAWVDRRDDGGGQFIAVLELIPVDSPRTAVQVALAPQSPL